MSSETVSDHVCPRGIALHKKWCICTAPSPDDEQGRAVQAAGVGVAGRANALLQSLEEIIGVVGSEQKTIEALRRITVALNTEAVRVCERVARERVSFTDDHDEPDFDRDLEEHRRNIYAMRQSRGISDNMVAEAVFFLLALAHQPEPRGVVEVSGSSPAHEYTPCHIPHPQSPRLRCELAEGHRGPHTAEHVTFVARSHPIRAWEKP